MDRDLQLEAICGAAKICAQSTKANSRIRRMAKGVEAYPSEQTRAVVLAYDFLENDSFDDDKILEHLSSALWVDPNTVLKALPLEVVSSIPSDWSQMFTDGPKGFINFRLLLLWLQGICEGRPLTEQEFLARLDNTTEGMLEFLSEAQFRERIFGQRDGNLLDKVRELYKEGSVHFVFRKATDARTPRERAIEALALLQNPP